MKTKETTKKKFDAVEMMRNIRNKIDEETADMTFEELKDYYKKSTEENRNKKNSNIW